MLNNMKTKSGLGTKLNGTKKIDSSHARRRKAVDFVMFTSDIRAITRTTKGNVQQNKRHTAQITAMKTSQKAIVPKTDRAWSVFGDSARPENECTYTHVSLFSGCGGIDLGFRQAGFKTLLANDIDPGACQTYRANLGEIIEGDVLNLSLPKLERRLDVLTAGFPCQPFSNAGSRKGVADYRGTLYQTAIDIVRKLEPRSIVFENVRGLLSFKSGNKLLIEEICEQLDTIGYDVVFSLVDSSRHHVPQRRLRLVIVGVERSANNGRFSFPEPVDRTDLSL
jgi:DNA (cytosine-5)-methyltransferase 1